MRKWTAAGKGGDGEGREATGNWPRMLEREEGREGNENRIDFRQEDGGGLVRTEAKRVAEKRKVEIRDAEKVMEID